MKKNFLLILFAMCLASPTWAYDFSHVYNSITIYYNDLGNSTSEITYGSSPYDFGTNTTYTPQVTTTDNGLSYTIGIGKEAFKDAIVSSSSFNLTVLLGTGSSYYVTYIGDRAFQNFNGLTQITINATYLESIGTAAFQGTGLQTISLPSGITTISDSTFYDCTSLTSIDFQGQVTSIGAYAFQNCSAFTSFEIPATVASIGAGAFANCIGLTEITSLNPEPPILDSDVFSGLDCSKITLHVPSGSETAYQAAEQWSEFLMEGGVTLKDGDVITVNGLTYTVISAKDGTVEVGSNNPYTGTANIPATFEYEGTTFTVIGIGQYAFGQSSGSNTTLTSVVMPNTITYVNDYAFYHCTGLTSVTFSDNLTTIGQHAFHYLTGWKEDVVLPESVTTIGANAFQYSFFNSMTLGENVSSIGTNAFYDCTQMSSFTSLNPTPPSLGSSVFTGSSYTGITLYVPSGSVETYSTTDQWKEFASIQEKVYEQLSIGSTFQVDGLYYTVVEGDQLVEVGSNLTYSGELVIPDDVTYDHVTYTVVGVGANAFGNQSGSHASVSSVKMTENVTYIGAYAFRGNSSITSVQLSKNIDTIGEYAFYNCTSLAEEIIIPEGVTALEQYTFASCVKLPAITLGSNVATLGYHALWDCDALTTITSLNPTPPTFDDSTEFQWDSATVRVPAGTIEEYQRVWGTPSGIVDYEELSYAVLKVTLATEDGVGYATYYDDSYDITLPTGYTAYWAESVSSGEVTLTEIEGGVIPAKTAVVIAGDLTDYATASATSSTEASTYTGNLLHGQPTTGSIEELEGNYLYYMLTTNTNGTDLGFYWGAADGGVFSSKANKAWLAVPVDGTSPASLSIKFKDKDDETTGISSLEVDGEGNSLNNGAIYTIQGVRVSNMNQPGLYIVDGRKVLVK